MMKTLIYFCLFGLLGLLGSCQDTDWAADIPQQPGKEVEVALNFQVQAPVQLSRAAQEEAYEFRVENIYLMIFDQQGNRVELTDQDKKEMNFYTPGAGLEDLQQGDSQKPTTGKLRFMVGTVEKARIVGIANLTSGTTATAYTVTPEELDKVTTLEELQAKILPMAQKGSIERGALFLMTGYAEDEKGSNVVDIYGKEGENITLNCSLNLRRADARITINVFAKSANPDLWKDFSFEPRTWQVMQVPQQTLLLPAEAAHAQTGDWDATGETCSYFNTPERVFEVVNRNEDKLYTGGSFTFYMPENRKKCKKQIPEDIASTMAENRYALRDKYSKTPTGENTAAFEYANDQSTYLILTGNLSYVDSKGYHVSTEARYIVHLGYVSKMNNQSLTPNVDDYNTVRNGKYTYNLTVTGVNSIIQEVTYEKEVRPGFEGHIVYSEKGFRTFDAHYDRYLLPIPVEYIRKGLTWGVNTPFSSGIYKQNVMGDEVPAGLKDYKWIKFAINKEYGAEQPVTGERYVKYPGDQNYDDPDIEGDNQSSPYHKNYPNARLMDIHQVTRYLSSKLADNSLNELEENGFVYVTAFLDENLYYRNPETQQASKVDLTQWKRSVDKSDRQLHIIYGEAKFSADGNSSVVNSFYTFSQKSIRTVYNIEKENLTTAWGLESTMETERLEPGDVSQGSDSRNGLANTLKWVVGKHWDEIIATTKAYTLNTQYNNVAYACMLRNRDLNGDNIIQANEVRWYLAAIDQLTDIYLGEYALDAEARLYPRLAADRPGGNSVYWHYTSSSYNSNDGGPWVLWSEEGASIGSYEGNGGSQDLNGRTYSYRCVRNLGVNPDDSQTIPEDLIKVTEQSDGYLVDLTNMNVKSRRTNLETVQLPRHNERSSNNRPYASFLVHKDVYPTPDLFNSWGKTDFRNKQSWLDYQTYDPSPAGFRIPNQRELLIMTTRLPDSAWPSYDYSWATSSSKPIYISYTSFSMNGQSPYNKQREGFIMHSDNLKLALQNTNSEKGFIRPVKDVAVP